MRFINYTLAIKERPLFTVTKLLLHTDFKKLIKGVFLCNLWIAKLTETTIISWRIQKLSRHALKVVLHNY